MRDNIEKIKKKWIENPSDEKSVLLYLPVSASRSVFLLLSFRRFCRL